MSGRRQVLIDSPFRAAGYIRLSREDGDKAESDSIGNQRKLIAEYLKGREDLTLYEMYIDDGFTGTNFNRPAFLRMIAQIEAGNVNCVIVKDLSRFGRDYIDTGKYLERYFPERQVRFISITDHIDSGKRAYDMLLPIRNIFNEQYARDISEKVRSSIRAKQRAGEFIGAFPSYGYRKSPADKNRLIVDEYAAGIVRRIFQMYLGGMGKSGIAAALNQEKIVCPSEYKRLSGENYRNSRKLESTFYWTYSTVNRILHNEIYAGNMVQGRKVQSLRGRQRAAGKEDWIVVKGTHEALIDAETWEKAQELSGRRTRSMSVHENVTVFAGFLRCGECGRSLVKKAAAPSSMRGYEGKGGVRYYCGTYVRSGRQYCSAHSIAHSVLERIVLDDLNALIRSIGDLKEALFESAGAQEMKTRGKEVKTPEKETKECGQAVKESGNVAKTCGRAVKARREETEAGRKEAARRARAQEQERLEVELGKVRRLKKAAYEDYREALLSREEYLAYRQEYCRKEEHLEKQLAGIKERIAREGGADMLRSSWAERLLSLGAVERLDREIVVEMVQGITVYEENRIEIAYRFSGELAGLFRSRIEG